MGKRKSARKPGAGKVKAKPLDKTFKCLFCQHIGTVLCKMDRANRIGRLDCKDCLQSFQAAITPLDEPIDLYSQWIDACEEVNTPAATTSRAAPNASARRPVAPAANNGDDDDDDDEELPDLPGTQKQQARKATADEDDEDEEEEEEDVGGVDEDEDDDADASIDASTGNRGYERKENSKMAALIEQKRSKAVVDDDEEDD